MRDEFFIDTNVLVYAYDSLSGRKHAKAREIVEGIMAGRVTGIVSNQVLAEFSSVLTKKLGADARVVFEISDAVASSKNWVKLNYSAGTVTRAVKLCAQTKANFWDALIAATLAENDFNKIYTENEADFARFKFLKVVNPFK